jgi:hypothetical protein
MMYTSQMEDASYEETKQFDKTVVLSIKVDHKLGKYMHLPLERTLTRPIKRTRKRIIFSHR